MKKYFLASILALSLGLAASAVSAQTFYSDGYYSDYGYGYGGCGYSCGSCYTCNSCYGGGVFAPVGFFWW
jgi:hypothetical protein